MANLIRRVRLTGGATLAIAVLGGSACAAPSAPDAQSDLVSDWMATAAAERIDWFEREPETSRPDAVVALAMFEAANAVERRYPSYLGFEPAADDLPVEIAASAAAATALTLLYPDRQAVFEEMQAAAAAGTTDTDDRRSAVELGERAALAAFSRGGALSEAMVRPYRTSAPAGVYVPTEAITAIAPFDLALEPWALASTQAARPPAPPTLDSEVYVSGLEEVRAYGGAEDAARSAEQTETAWFWFFIDMNPILRQIAETPDRSLAQNARMYAMFYMATDDAWIASADAKAHYQFWRPITAIRQADRDGNAATEPDFGWAPLIPTPPHPEYPCAHCVQAAAQAVVLAGELDDPERTFEIASSTTPDAASRRVTLADYVEQTALSRIYAGAHYRFSNDAGVATGERVGRAVLERWMRGGP